MFKFQEASKTVVVTTPSGIQPEPLIARRYAIQRKLGSGGFGTVYLVLDKKAKKGEELKVLKEISVGDLKPNETVQANLEAQLLSKLDHPAIVKFYTSFLERDSFCIITEYCEGRDLDCKIKEYKQAGKIFPESQIVEWFLQLLLGVYYMHERRILHRDLKAKNIFMKNNLVKIGDFGVSRLLMGSCDLATTFTGTPYYMSPEALTHQGYDSKSDIWSLACILYEMCCLDHVFTGHNFMSVVLKIVEGETPSLPGRYSSELNSIMQSMLNKSPSMRPSAATILKMPYINEQLQNIKCKFSNLTIKDKTLNCQKEAVQIMNALQKKVHLQTLRELSEVQKMTPRERMRLRKLQAADEKAKKLKQLAEEKYQENHKRMQELRSRNFQRVSMDVLHECSEQTSQSMSQSQPVTTHDCWSIESICLCCTLDLGVHQIPEDPQRAEEYYYEDGFDSCSEDSVEEEPEEETLRSPPRMYQQDSDVEAMVICLENVLGCNSLGTGTVTRMAPAEPQGRIVLNSTMAETKMKRMRESIIEKLGAEVFEKVYDYLKKAREQNANEAEVREYLGKLVAKPSDCFEVDQLLYFEEQLMSSTRKHALM
ncbi:serine/threonine-protein kinase Nek11 isoform X2 [Latimeria chalumnae]|uniref:serine/threonine-protein kinase Nek11 isoform X2 n=1 Tax=Latimeria chalumnae TaxID=7897 RepID=UPI00313ED731